MYREGDHATPPGGTVPGAPDLPDFLRLEHGDDHGDAAREKVDCRVIMMIFE